VAGRRSLWPIAHNNVGNTYVANASCEADARSSVRFPSGPPVRPPGLDDRISTGHEPAVWAAAHHLTDLVVAWWDEAVHGIAYRSRTTPQTSANVALFHHAPLAGRSQRLDRASTFLDILVVSHGFTVELRASP
jgi:hypothetical protein